MLKVLTLLNRGATRNSSHLAISRARGFTIIELIVIISLLGILSAVAISRFGDTQTYHDLQLRDQLISIARVAQQASLNRHNQNVTLEVSRSDDWLFEVMVETTPGNHLSLKRQAVEPSNATFLDPTGSVVGTTPYVVAYDNLGNLASGAIANLAFSVSGDIACVSLAGYAYPAIDMNDCIDN